jgi:hypothetical protein
MFSIPFRSENERGESGYKHFASNEAVSFKPQRVKLKRLGNGTENE